MRPRTVEDIKAMKNIKTVISLKETVVMKEELLKNNKIVFNIPIRDYSIPTYDLVENFFEIVDRNFPVLVHCHAGLGRTGMMTALYLITHLKITPKDSIEIVRKITPGSIETVEQLNFIYSYKNKIDFNPPMNFEKKFETERERLLGYIN